MRLNTRLRNVLLEFICLLYILLFVYAAVSKLLDFENFEVQLGQSPLLSAFAGWVSWGVPIVELVIALLLLVPRFRLVGLLAAFSLMTMFTTYIIIILNFSPFIPCSCGGILEKMGWREHLVFNIVFVVLALIGILLMTSSKTIENTGKIKRFFITVLTSFICSIGLVVLLFVLSEDIIRHHNNFVRRFPHHPVMKTHEMDIKFNSYYIAGIDNGKIYLGNNTAPLHVLVLDIALQHQKSYTIKLPKSNLSFRSVQVRVQPPYFYLMDGTVPCIFRGNTTDWNASLQMYIKAYFTAAEPLNAEIFAMRAISSKNHENVLGTIKINGSTKVKLAPHLLKKQIDGVFDTDGMLLYNKQLEKILYLYYYRNEYLVTDTSLNSVEYGHTIDTISRAQIKVAHIRSRNQNKLAKPPLIVNKSAATFANYLFISAALMGRYETEAMWDKASIIDVYDFIQNTYQFSFYIPNRLDQKMTDFRVIDGVFVVLFDHYIITYKIQSNYFEPKISKPSVSP